MSARDTSEEPAREWLEADGLGGFASGCSDLTRTRRYHGLLQVARGVPNVRVRLVQAVEAWLICGERRVPLSSHRYGDDVVHPEGRAHLRAFRSDPWPRWTFDAGDLGTVDLELFVPRGVAAVCLTWRLEGAPGGARIEVRPLLSCCDLHALSQESNERFQGVDVGADRVAWHLGPALPTVRALHSGRYVQAPDWYRNFELGEERARGYDHREALFSPGLFDLELVQGTALLILHADESLAADEARPAADLVASWRRTELRRRGGFATRLERSAESYLVRRGSGRTVIAGYPWFADWGRDTLLSLRGLCLATGRLEEAESILLEWSRHESLGMLPNRFPEDGGPAEYNSVDAALWFAVAVHELGCARASVRGGSGEDVPTELARTVEAIVTACSEGTRHGIGADEDGLLRAGTQGVQLTWMDARVDGREVTPRIGKPVEVQALWINALWIASRRQRVWRAPFQRALRSFLARFWNEERRCLYDVVDVDHVRGTVDASLRPNQLLAVGGLPRALLSGLRARSVVTLVEKELWTPLGPRSLAPTEPGYRGRYRGDVTARDLAYHQGSVWPWLAGPFVEAWVRVRGGTSAARREARDRFVLPLLAHLDQAGLGHLSEVADGDAPHRPGGAPFQAWSLAELLRLERSLLAGAPLRGHAYAQAAGGGV